MAFIYVFLLGALFFSKKEKKKPSKRVWILAFISIFLTIACLIYHGISPLEIKI